MVKMENAAGERHFDLLLKGGVVVNHAGRRACDIAISGDTIAAFGDFAPKQADRVIDCTGLYILPGVIDSHVHFREPGFAHKETLHSGSQAAVLGGVTAIFDMPNTSPPTTNQEALNDKLARAASSSYCDFAFWVGASADNIDELAYLEQLPGAAGIKLFMGSSTGNLLVEEEEALRKILQIARRRIVVHAEDESILKSRLNLRIEGDVASHSHWRDASAALSATQRLVKLARQYEAKIHILHISTKEEVEFLAAHKDIASIEVTPHHLTLSSDDYQKLGSLMQMNPPIREAYHRSALWQALDQGIIDILGSDHAPHSLAEKQKPYPASPSGIIGVQTSLSLMLNYVNQGKLTLERLVDMTSHNVQRLFNIARKGRMACGYDADFTIIDLNKEYRIDNKDIASLPGWTPYHHMAIRGGVIGTVIRGQLVMWQGQIMAPPSGQRVHFLRS